MAVKPSNLIYGVDDRPPPGPALLLGLQHVAVLSAGWILVLVIVTGMGGTGDQAANVIRISMIVSGIATILQAGSWGPVGSGYLCPFSPGPAYISASIFAGRAGGLPLVFGLTAVAGLFEGLLARVLPRLRPLLPPEVTGLVVMMVGVQLVVLGCPRFFGATEPGSPLHGPSTVVAMATLAAMVVPTLSQGKLRLYPILIGLATGYIAAAAAGLLATDRLQAALAEPLMSVPSVAPGGWAFDVALLPVFLIASLASVLKAVGDLTLCQQVNDTGWKRTDMDSVSGGVMAGSVGNVAAGLFGGAGLSTFSSNVGLSMATGATSRSIAVPCGVILIALAFFPKLAALITVVPDPVTGAMLVYVAAYMILGGIQVLTSRMLDARKIFVVGFSMIFGLSVDMVPGLYEGVPAAFAPIFSSSLALATILAVILNLVFRIGIARRVMLELTPGSGSRDRVYGFMESSGSGWGARPEVVRRATAAVNEFVESAAALDLARGEVRIEARFDEFNLDVEIDYEGVAMAFPTSRPNESELLEDEGALARLSGFMIRQYADRIRAGEEAGRCRIHLHFDH